MNHHIAVDIGASSGRLIVGTIEDGRLYLEEIHRFSNGFSERNGHLFWNVDYLLDEILVGLHKAKLRGITSCTVGIDTWAVDYVLIGHDGQRKEDVFAYRDARTNRAIEQVTQRISKEIIYQKTGIQFLNFNTLFQLAVHDRNQLKETASLLLIPDYLYYKLSGKLFNEVTNASTTQLLNLKTADYDLDLLQLIGLERSQFPNIVEPGQSIGPITQELIDEYELPLCELVTVATHDTASAVLGVPARVDQSWAFISSGTWSLIGIESDCPYQNEQALQANFTNEAGAGKTIRFLKNIMGLWMIQELRRKYDEQYTFEQFVELAKTVSPFVRIIDCNNDRFMNPPNIIEEIKMYCQETGQPIPVTVAEVVRTVYDSLAVMYALHIEEIEAITGRDIEVVHIVGGGAYNELLCQISATLSNKKVTAGPIESTAIGNIVVQMICEGKIAHIDEARQIIRNSFPFKEYLPEELDERRIIIQSFKTSIVK